MSSPLDAFFKLGDKVTKGDPARQADFVYYMVWILFSAFLFMFGNNLYHLITKRSLQYLTWTLTGFAISGIQFFTLKGMYDMKQLRNKPIITKEETTDLESMEEMMETFGEDKSDKLPEVKKCSEIKHQKK